MDVEQWKERAKKYRNQSGEVKTNEAYKALLHEIQNAEDEVAKAEDRLLERMVSGEEYDRQVKAAEAAVKEIEAAANKERHAIQAEYNATQKELTAAEAVRAAAVAAVPEDLVDHYERIAKRHGGIALAEIRGEGCGQCGVHIRPHVIQQLQRDSNEGFFHCETCTRILYYADHSAPRTSTPLPPPRSPPPEIRQLPPSVKINRKAQKFKVCGSDISRQLHRPMGPLGPEASGAKAQDIASLNDQTHAQSVREIVRGA